MTLRAGDRSDGGCALNRFFDRLQMLFVRMAPYALVLFLVALSTLLFLDGTRSSSTLLGALFGTKRRDHVLRPVESLSPMIMLPLCYLAVARSRGRGSHGMPAGATLGTGYDDLAGGRDNGLLRRFSHVGGRERRIFFATICGDASRGVRHTGATYRLNSNRETLEMIADEGIRARTPAQVEDRRRRSVYWDALKEKYERAAGYPWLSVEPDPPPP